jgi:hypothetical protein
MLILIGGFLVMFFPSTKDVKKDEFTIAAIVMGLIFLFIGVTFVLT